MNTHPEGADAVESLRGGCEERVMDSEEEEDDEEEEEEEESESRDCG